MFVVGLFQRSLDIEEPMELLKETRSNGPRVSIYMLNGSRVGLADAIGARVLSEKMFKSRENRGGR